MYDIMFLDTTFNLVKLSICWINLVSPIYVFLAR